MSWVFNDSLDRATSQHRWAMHEQPAAPSLIKLQPVTMKRKLLPW
jgi:hypothetical protein